MGTLPDWMPESDFQKALATNQKFESIDEGDPIWWKASGHIRIRVYLINGRFDNPCGRSPAVWRRPVRYKGKWCVRDHGWVPLRGTIDDGGGRAYVT